MTCPVPHQELRADNGAASALESNAAVERFERVGGSVLFSLFGVGLFDQPMLPPVSAALEATGRSRYEPWGRAVRTAAADQLIYHGEDVDRDAESRRLMLLHRDVKGVGPDGERYSALNPHAWNWILYSTFFVQRSAYVVLTGDTPSAADNQAIWEQYLHKTSGLHLPGNSAPIADYTELVAHYDRMVAELRVTPALEAATTEVRRSVRPYFLPAVTEPLWRLSAPVLGHLAMILGCGIMHPEVRAKMPITWTSRQDREFRLLSAILRIAFARLPAAVTDSPMARNRRKYQQLVGKYREVGLTSFAPDPAVRSIRR
ncbi:oxygenase MpaB family protein [Nocardia salmonicida]|uniref:oxygenase MpaB family protein n=1 Tax=Nocardia salmonicida TaxID=53431 RepID=UPI0007A479FD|nr:oxygenase MpaB family protein [Nocardia salmonicida]